MTQKIESKVEMIQRSAARLVKGLYMEPRNEVWSGFMKNEVQLCQDRLAELKELLESMK